MEAGKVAIFILAGLCIGFILYFLVRARMDSLRRENEELRRFAVKIRYEQEAQLASQKARSMTDKQAVRRFHESFRKRG
jgi:uncharacterized protein YneF (UPF0154 family)